MKTLKFRDYLVPLVMSGEKNSTWRLFDDKELSVGDDVELQMFVTNKPFAKAKIVDVIEKQFKELSKDDKKGQVSFKSDDEMYVKFTEYYKQEITPETSLKIVRFELI